MLDFYRLRSVAELVHEGIDCIPDNLGSCLLILIIRRHKTMQNMIILIISCLLILIIIQYYAE